MKKQIIWNRQTLKLAWILPVLAALLAASLFARAADSQVAHIGGYEEGQSFSLCWIDNHNQEGDRPTASTDPAAAAALQPRLSFVLDGKEENPYRLWEYEGEMLSQALALVGLDEVPQAAVDTAGGMDVNSYTVSFGDSALPSLVYYEGEWDPDANDGAGGPATDPETGEPYPGHTVTWTVEPAEVADYNVVNVTEDTADQYPSAANGPGWYYVQQTKFTFTISLRWGTLDELDGVRAAILSHFSLNVLDAGDDVLRETLLDALDEDALSIAYYKDGEPIGTDDNVDPAMDDPDTAVFTVRGGWKYNLDGSLLTYRVEEIAEDGAAGPDQILRAGGLEEGDYFAVSYDNSASAGHGSADGAAYDGGTIYLTLTGATDYSATKVWLEPEGFSAEGRPDLEFHLYRYREGTDYTSAAPVRDEDDQPVVLTVESGDVVYSNANTAEISYGLDEDLLATLPKYDSEGYRYLYVVREVMTGGSQAYEQVFGTVVDGAVVEDEDRQSGDTYLYDEGTLLNRISDTVTTAVTKVWNASAFQSGFENVSVELTLQVREKGSNDPWETATDSSGREIVRNMEGFTSETLSGTTLEVSVPRYGGTGVELEYRWVETGVTQGGNTNTTFESNGTTASFQLRQSDGLDLNGNGDPDTVTVRYMSTSETDDNATTITNTAIGKIEYHLEKVWRDAQGNEIPADAEALRDITVTFRLYQLLPGQSLGAETAPYLTFAVRYGEDVDVTKNPSDPDVSVTSAGGWDVDVTGLPQFDSSGRQYEYVLLEDGTQYVTGYTTTRDENRDYTTVATNTLGEGGHRILVQKTWLDDSDAAHRQPVTVTVYSRDTKQPIKVNGQTVTAVLGQNQNDTGGNSGVWWTLVGIDTYRPDQVYVVETAIGDTLVDASNVSFIDEASFFYSGVGDTSYAYQHATGDFHRYEVTYTAPQEVGGETLYNINNRRLGNIDLTVTKHWRAGDNADVLGELSQALDSAGLRLALKLEFHPATPATSSNGYKIDYDYDTVTVGGAEAVAIQNEAGLAAAAIQTIRIPDGMDGTKDEEYYFFNLPKYAPSGEVVRYTVEEILVDASGQEVDFSALTASDASEAYRALAQALSRWQRTVEDGTYDAAEDGTNINDAQAVDATNRLTGTTEASWNKVWKDQYNKDNGLRPDIYLDIYREYHDPNDKTKLVRELYLADYLWSSEDDGTWTATISGLPQYDSWGYEIRYYAVERTHVDAAAFSYQPVKYSYGDTDLGDRTTITDGNAGPGQVLALVDGSGNYYDWVNKDYGEGYHYALGDGGTFTNTIRGQVTLTGQKLWTALPSGFARVDLPSATFTLYQMLADDVGKDLEYVYDKTAGSTDPNPGSDPIDPDMSQPDVIGLQSAADSSLVYKSEYGNPAASLTVDNWASVYANGSYQFQFTYQGKNTMTATENVDGTYTVKYGWESDPNYPDIKAEATLPRFDSEGRLYTYTLAEAEVDFANGTDQDLVFTSVGSITTPGTFLVDNVYDSVKGALAVKKLLCLPTDEKGEPAAFPAVTFQLSRTYTVYGETGTEQTQSEPEVVATVTWSAAEVKEAYDQAKADAEAAGGAFDPASTPLEWTHPFEGLEIYAPNGSEYQYTVTEVKDYLGDYDTWAAQGDLTAEEVSNTTKQDEVAGLTPAPDATDENGGPARGDRDEAANPVPVKATFLNRRATDLSTVQLQGTKVWSDYGNAFGLRPDTDDPGITLKVARYAQSAPGENNGMGSQSDPYETLTLNVDYTVTWTDSDADDNQWTYTITGTGADGNELERHAPNGMPWTYVVTETAEDPYRPSVGTVTGTWAEDPDDPTNDTVQLHSGAAGSLTNSILINAGWSKAWKDSAGDPISENFLTGDISVQVKLQVAELTVQNGAVTKDGWSDAKTYFETNLAPETREKVFNEANGNTSFTVTRSAPIHDTAFWSATQYFRNLPRVIVKQGESDATYLAYRVVEERITYTYNGASITCDVNPENDTMGTGSATLSYTITVQDSGEADSLFSGAEGSYTVSNTRSTSILTNTMRTTSLTVAKVWQGDNGNAYHTRPDPDGDGSWEVSFLIQRSTDSGTTWTSVQVQTGTDGSAPVYQDRVVTLTGGDGDATVSAVISGLPMGPMYRAVELKPGYEANMTNGEVAQNDILEAGSTFYDAYTVAYHNQSVGSGSVPGEGDSSAPASDDINGETADPGGSYTTVTNTLTTISRSAQKSWQAPESVTRPSITLTLQYLAADGRTWTDLASVTLDGTADTDGAETVNRYGVYYEDDPWHAVWDGLPTRLPGSDLTTGSTQYRVVERDITGWVQVSSSEGSDAADFTFTNAPSTSLQVVKQWSSVPDSSGLTVTVGLYRTTVQSEVGSAADGNRVMAGDEPVTATLNVDGGWTHTFADLPLYDGNSQRYYYYALELSVGGAPVANSGSGGTFTLVGVEYTVSYDHDPAPAAGTPATTITNSVYGQRTVTKVWQDNGNELGDRPVSVTVALYANGAPYTGEEATSSATLNADNSWTYTWTGLEEYDASGAPITYTVRELSATLADGSPIYPSGPDADGTYTLGDYVVTISGFTVTNTRYGGLEVSKTVAGDGDPAKQFHFVVTLDDTGITGTYGGMTFENGVAQFTLTHGQSATAAGLPAGTGYTVTETEANQDGYRTTSTGAAGTIPAESTAHAAFVNRLSGGTDPDPDPDPSTTTVTGTKTWVDDNDSAGLRPGSLKLTLYRSSDGGRTWTAVNATPSWSKNGNVWRYTFHDLPGGYTYRVEETVPEGYSGRQSGNNFINTLVQDETVDIPVTKVWQDENNAANTRPESIVVVLYADGVEVLRHTLTQGEGWSHTFTDLPVYNADGTAIVYTVAEENVPDGYSASYDGYTIINTGGTVELGDLTVSKTVEGTGSDPERQFRFTVTLSDRTINGTYGGMTFEGGVATFTLTGGQSVTAAGLPAGVTYTVAELEADQDGYETSASGDTGTIPAGGAAHASFVNHRDQPDDTPQTGDPTHTWLWLALCLASLGAAGLLLTTRPRSKRGRRVK